MAVQQLQHKQVKSFPQEQQFEQVEEINVEVGGRGGMDILENKITDFSQ